MRMAGSGDPALHSTWLFAGGFFGAGAGGFFGGAGTRGGGFGFAAFDGRVAFRFLARGGGSLALFRGVEFHAGAARFGKADGDGLFARPDVAAAAFERAHLFANEFAGLGGRFFSGAGVFARAFFGSGFGHESKGL